MFEIPAIILYTIVVVAIVVLGVLVVRGYIKNNPKELPMDEMEGHDFEYYCADLLKNSGFLDVEVTKGSGDFGADILAEKDGVTYAFQCKCYDKPIGVKAVQEIYAGRDFYGRMVGVVMTNQYFTQPAVELAGKLNIMLWDRGYLDNMDS
ncbi:restriction endonuclease [Butyrivibrio sp. CB08]|uniref:restriction endonuclease n=1 Tax=Butyrivibrio sp. CB08 TaxID=2364879 RepID=UPI000EAAA4D2|nr:restriction endonuclease [Butyrivibrio sp. CB08]RKM58748.1 restriction endonuclease [Butyrivibrio sp. CB08]